MIAPSQMSDRFRLIINAQLDTFNRGASIQLRTTIPPTSDIPLQDNHWLKIPNVICVFVDMKNSTKLSATHHDKTTAAAYQLFTDTAIDLLHEFDAPYIDVKGDGVFALFNESQPYRALAAAVTFKTFASSAFQPKMKEVTNLEIGAHIGIDQKTVLVRRLGKRRTDGRTDRQNEVWAGKPVNMASKLASRAHTNQIWVSDRYYEKLKDPLVRMSCGCKAGTYIGEKVDLWKELEVSDIGLFDFKKIYCLESVWCQNHGREFMDKIIALDR